MDRNQIIGFSLLAVLLVFYLFYNQHEQKVFNEQRVADSLAYVKLHPRQIIDSTKNAVALGAAKANDSLTEAQKSGMPNSYYGKSDTVVFENKKLSLKFSTKGGFPFAATLKDFVTYGKAPLTFFNGRGSSLSAILPYDNGKSTADLYFTPSIKENPNGDKTIDFSGELKDGKKVDLIYTLPANDYMIQCDLVLTGMAATNPVSLHWQESLLQTEKDMASERLNAQIYYHQKNGDHNYFTMTKDIKPLDEVPTAVSWLGLRKQFFSTALISDEGFVKMDSKYGYDLLDTNITAANTAVLQVPLKAGVGNQQVASMKWYIGPNDYNTLSSYKIGLDEMVPLGSGFSAFAKYINKYALIPFFYFLNSFISSYALIIMLMTISIRLVLSFFTYKSYLSSAKMRVMKPELDELKVKCGDDTQKFSMEQMKLYRSAGVNPLGGCLPMLFQLPILLSMYYMFPSFIEFRQKSFLWAPDLSTYDSILDFHFNVPFYGDHVSLFCLLMTGSSLFLALYNRNMTPQDPNNPMMKYMPYIFPVMLMGVFNKMAAALTFYYFFSNILSMVQQFVIQKYFINETAIHAQLQENKTKVPVQSKWAQKLEEIQKMQAEKSKPQQRINKK